MDKPEEAGAAVKMGYRDIINTAAKYTIGCHSGECRNPDRVVDAGIRRHDAVTYLIAGLTIGNSLIFKMAFGLPETINLTLVP